MIAVSFELAGVVAPIFALARGLVENDAVAGGEFAHSGIDGIDGVTPANRDLDLGERALRIFLNNNFVGGSSGWQWHFKSEGYLSVYPRC